MSKAVDYLKVSEEGKSVTVIDVEDEGTPCRGCGLKGVVYTVHCWREEERPILALCKPCTETRAGGPAQVALRGDRPGLETGWRSGQRALLTDRQMRQRRAASLARLDRPNRAGVGFGDDQAS